MKSYFDKIAKTVHAKDFKSKIGRVFAYDDMFDGSAKKDAFFNELPNIVVHNGKPISWFLGFENAGEDSSPSPGKKAPRMGPGKLFEDLLSESCNRRTATPVRQLKLHELHEGDVIAPGTTFLECVELLAVVPERLLVVVNRGKPVGSVQFRNLFDPIGRLCLLRLVLDMEVAAIDLLLVQDGKRTATWLKEEIERDKKSRNGSQETASARMRDRFFDRHPLHANAFDSFDDSVKWYQCIRLLLAALSFSRRRDIIKRLKLLANTSNTQIDKIFGRAESLRNCCAHPTGFEDERFAWTPEPEFDKAKFPKLYRDIRWLTVEMRDQAERERKVSEKSF